MVQTFAQPLAAAGWHTGFFGKWHMGNDDSPRPGFTRWVAMQGQGEATDPQFNIDGTRARERGYVTDLLTDHVVDFVREPGGQPFMVFLAHKALHPNIVQRDDGSTGAVAGQAEGFVPAPRHQRRYADTVVPHRPNAGPPVAGKPALQRDRRGSRPWDSETRDAGSRCARPTRDAARGRRERGADRAGARGQRRAGAHGDLP